jgi:hypothetical protein
MKYHITFSDRQRARHIIADSAADAIRAARRDLIHARLNTWSDTELVFDLAIQTGPTRHGSTPFRNISAIVTGAAQ